jgi:hypothetical protein
MDEPYFVEVFEWKVNGVKPERFKGSANKGSWRMWKKKVDKIELLKKNREREMTRDNVKVTMLRQDKYKIVPLLRDLDDLWEHFHCDSKTGAHQGYASLRRRMCRVYFIPNFEGWVKEKLQDCKVCSLTRRKDIVPPTGAIVPSEPKKSWQMDFIGKFKTDAKYGHRYVVFVKEY